MDRDYDDWFPSISLTMPVGKIRIAIFAKQRHTIMLLSHCEAGPYATYGYRNHRRHTHRPLVVLRVDLRAAIFTKCWCHQLVYDCSVTDCTPY